MSERLSGFLMDEWANQSAPRSKEREGPGRGTGALKVVSGGQTGVDRAALDAALGLGLPCGGWRPQGRRAEDGRIPDRYPLTETPGKDYPTRTRRNVRDSDFTLVLTVGEPTGGTLLTVQAAKRQGRPCVVVDLADEGRLDAEAQRVRGLLVGHLLWTWP